MSQPIVYYSQNKEDLILASIFKGQEKGFYVDVGANHPTYDSVTKYFYEKGWNGINIEPIKSFYTLLQIDRPKDTNINIGISSKNGMLNLREYFSEAGEGMSTFSDDLKKQYSSSKHWATTSFKDYEVETRMLSQVFEEEDVKSIDFMKIDVEGLEYEVINSNNWTEYRPKFICIESNHIIKDWRPILKANGYELFFNDGLNNYYFDKRNNPNFTYSYSEDLLMKYSNSVHYNKYIQNSSTQNELTYTKLLLNLLASRTLDTRLAKEPKGPKYHLRELIKSLDQKAVEIKLITIRNKEIKRMSASSSFKQRLKKAYIQDHKVRISRSLPSSVYIVVRPIIIGLRKAL